MFLVDLIAVVLILLYFWYMSRSDSPASMIPQPSGSPNHISPFAFMLKYHDNDHYLFRIDNRLWHTEVPDNYVVRDGKILEIDACHGKTDGTHVLASGQQLYQFLQRDTLITLPQSFEPDATSTLQDKRIFYFTCKDDYIDRLSICKPGQIFQQGACQDINVCSGLPDSTLLSNPYDSTQYYECQKETPVVHKCPIGTRFIHDECKDYEIDAYCQGYGKDPKILDPKTLLVCDGDRVTFETCPAGFRYFDLPHCETDACVGQLDGARMPLPPDTEKFMIYSPGYMTCKANRMDTSEQCPKQWDSYLGRDRLSFLPQVFDGKECTVPEFCTNVTPTDPNMVVPLHSFSKHISNWPLAKAFDQVKGTQCEGKNRIAYSMPPGQRINTKDFKIESACDTPNTKAIVQNSKYYDCATQQEVNCPRNHFFNSVECKPSNDHYFNYRYIDLFTMDPLSEHDWIKPWDYLKKESIKDTCTDPDFILNKTYNVCIHPDCTKYPFLSKTPFKIGLRDQSECVYDQSSIVKKSTSSHYLYWSQREVDDPNQTETCVPRSNVKSGHFVKDATLYATCDESQPFIFCPSATGSGIDKDISSNRWYCVPPNASTKIPPGTTRKFVKNEIALIKQSGSYLIGPTVVNINNKPTIIPKHGGYDMTTFGEHVTLETFNHSVNVIFQYIVLHPPDIVYHYDKSTKEGFIDVSRTGGAFLTKLASFTQKPLDLPEYKIVPGVPQFVA